MNLYEFEGKDLFRQAGIPTPRGEVVASREEARSVAEKLGFPVMLKGQVLSGGRGKAGGIQLARNPEELERVADTLFKMQLGSEKVFSILIEEGLHVSAEYYLGISFDPEKAMPLLMLSTSGGVDIEEVAQSAPHKIVKKYLDPLERPGPHHMLEMAKQVGLSGPVMVQVSHILFKLVNCYFRFDAITTEINPLIIDDKDRMWAADAKVEIDDSALFRLPEIRDLYRSETSGNALEEEARAAGVIYVRLNENGNIGLIAGGAGVGMAKMETVYHFGGVPANFLDLGGIATPEKTAAALKIVLKTPGVQGVFLNAFGGINNCREMAEGVVRVIEELNPEQIITVKMRGHSQEEGWALLEEKNIPVVKLGTTEDGIALLIREMEKKE
jgi:succinyl-CoA synthetase beta subunit